MKRVVMLILALSVCLLWGCGSTEESGQKTDAATLGTDGPIFETQQQTQPTTQAAAEPVVYETGAFSVKIPDGWTAVAVTDPFAETPDTLDPDALHIGKGISQELDLFTHPYIRVDYYGPDQQWYSPRDFYEDPKDLEPFTTGGHTWEGFTVAEYGTVNAVLISRNGDLEFQVTVILENGDKKISLEDEDVRMILESITAMQ